MNDKPDPDRDKLRDRLNELALKEVVGHRRPPDLTARILAAAELHEHPVQVKEPVMSEASKSHRGWKLYAVAASLLMLATGGLVFSVMPSRDPARIASSNSQRKSDTENLDQTSAPRGSDVNEQYEAPDEKNLFLSHVPNSGESSDPNTDPRGQDGTNSYSKDFEADLSAEIRKKATGSEIALDSSVASGPTGGAPAELVRELPPSTKGDARAAPRDALPLYKSAPTRIPKPKLGSSERNASPAASEAFGDPFGNAAGGGVGGGGAGAFGAGLAGRAKNIQPDFDEFRELITSSAPIRPDAEGQGPGRGGDQYDRIVENPFISVADEPQSTFSIDVDTASYANVRQFLFEARRLPPPDAVRIEELVNYFDYRYDGPTGEDPFAAHVEVATCPWEPEHRLMRVGLKGKEIDRGERPDSNLVFLLDVSGSMNQPAKLPLLKEGMKLLAEHLESRDRVAIVVYAGSEGLVLPSTSGGERETIVAALDRLAAGGSTNGGAGIELAYKLAQENFIEGGVNRVILCTDGDFNVGITSHGALVRMVEERAKSGTFLSVLGFGRGNLNDAMMEEISNKGNGNYAYVDRLSEARKVLIEQMSGTLVTIAKDVKIQIEFNPAKVAGYRLIGYENRILAARDFDDDKKDAGEIGAGHTVTAVYEIVPAGESVKPGAPPLKYQKPSELTSAADGEETGTLALRYKQPDGDVSKRLEFPIRDASRPFSEASADTKFAAAVAAFGMLLRDSEHKGNATYDAVIEIANEAKGADPHGYRAEFIELVHRAKGLAK